MSSGKYRLELFFPSYGVGSNHRPMVVPKPLTRKPKPRRLNGDYLAREFFLFENVGADNIATALNAINYCTMKVGFKHSSRRPTN